MSFVCPICARQGEDERHVSVECFYDVHEVAPHAEKQLIFREVKPDSTYWGTTHTYPAGTRDEHRTEATGESSFQVHVDQVACDPIRLIEQHTYSLSCCKPCRSDFLRLFGEWAAGTYVTRHEPDEVHCIPLRERGATIFISEEQWRMRHQDRRI